jgi:hypothetical protein
MTSRHDFQKFVCGGRLIFGPDAGSLFLSTILIATPLVGLCFQCITKLSSDVSEEQVLGLPVLIVTVLLGLAVSKPHAASLSSPTTTNLPEPRQDIADNCTCIRAGFRVPALDVQQGPRDRAEERAPAGARGGRRHAVHRVGDDARREPEPPAAAHQGRRGRRRARRARQVLRHVPAVPAAEGVALLHLRQLRPEVRPPLPLGRPVHWTGAFCSETQHLNLNQLVWRRS